MIIKLTPTSSLSINLIPSKDSLDKITEDLLIINERLENLQMIENQKMTNNFEEIKNVEKLLKETEKRVAEENSKISNKLNTIISLQNKIK